MTKVGFIVENHQYLTSLKGVIRLQPDITCALAETSIQDFWARLPTRINLDIIFLDIDFPGQCGVEAISTLKRRFEKAEIIILANCEDDQMLLRAISAGASGYIGKEFPLTQLPQMIRTATSGGALISPRMARLLIDYFKPATKATEMLRSKEEQLLRLFYEGHTYEESANILGLSIDGVKYHVKNIYRKLKVDNKVDALRVYREGLK